MANDDLAEAAALTQHLREMISTLDQRIEHRAHELAVERGEHSFDRLFSEAMSHAQLAGEAWRREMMERVPEGREFAASLPASAWTAAAAGLVSEVCDELVRRERGERRG